ncbi:MAG: carboxymuconolactone decarboxylase family protein [Gammaproteobacteria bacterium]
MPGKVRKRSSSAAPRRDRMPPIPKAKQTAAQRVAARELAATPRGGVIGPFVPALRSPEFMTLLQRLGEYLRYRCALGPRLTELVILLTARAWTQQFEWLVHAKTARAAGLSAATIAAIAAGRWPATLEADEAVVYDFFAELEDKRSVGDASYARARATLGEQGIVDLVGVAGYYATLAMLMNVARTPLPRGRLPALKRLRPRKAR